MDNCDMMAEVDAEIAKILKNKATSTKLEKENSFCNGNNLQKCLQQLSQDFDYLDVNAIKTIDLDSKKGVKNLLVQLANSSYNLLKLQQETQKNYSKNCDKNTSNQSEIIFLRKINESLRKELKTKEAQIRLQNERKELENIQNNDIKSKLVTAKKEINQLKKENEANAIRHKCEIQRAFSESRKIEERFRKKCGFFQSAESQALGVLDEYAQNETKLLKTIDQLQANNHELLEEIVALRGEIAQIKCSRAAN